jgi:CBS domain containing-hemolysin-like protein
MTLVTLEFFGDYAVGIATGILTFLILIFGEIMPKATAVHNSEKLAQAFAPLLWVFVVLLHPILVAIDWMLNRMFGLFGMSTGHSSVTEDEIMHLVTAGEEGGTIREIERSLIKNVFAFDEKLVVEIVTPSADMVTLPATATVGRALELIGKTKHSRIPIHGKRPDNIVGIVSLRDLLGRKKETSVRRVMKIPYTVPETKRISELLRRFQKRKEHMAIVVDEHGTTAGLVTLEDVLEEIVGDIVDDAEQGDPNIAQIGKKMWSVRGRTPIVEANEKLKLRIPEGEYDTIGGFVLKKLGHIPRVGEEIVHRGATMHVDQMHKHRIDEIVVKK